MAGSCPKVDYGIGSGGAYEYNINSGRELFRCGSGCVKIFIVNVTCEKTLVKVNACGNLKAGDQDYCIQNVNGNARKNFVVNWEAKNGANSGWDNGSVLNKVASCNNTPAKIFTHIEANMSARCYINTSKIDSKKDTIVNQAKQMLGSPFSNYSDWIMNDVGITVSPNDWQSATLSFLDFEMSENKLSSDGYRASFNNMNGMSETGTTTILYDESDTRDFKQIIKQWIS